MYPEKPKHGGNLRHFCSETGHRSEDCLDLSTGVSPWAWPVPPIPKKVWGKLPGNSEQSVDLLAAAAGYYDCGAEHILALPGSQSAIQQIPSTIKIDPADRVALPALGYQEHAYCWSRVGAKIEFYNSLEALKAIAAETSVRFVVVINPNNPTAESLQPEKLLPIAELMANRKGFLLVDEAFADATPELSLSSYAGQPGLLILRSIGKFFGLPGLRLGFALGPKNILSEVEEAIGPWAVNAAAEYYGAQLLRDEIWIKAQRYRLQQESEQMFLCLQEALPSFHWRASGLFLSAPGLQKEIRGLADRLAKQAIMVRIFELNEEESLIRVGLAYAENRRRLLIALTTLDQLDTPPRNCEPNL